MGLWTWTWFRWGLLSHPDAIQRVGRGEKRSLISGVVGVEGGGRLPPRPFRTSVKLIPIAFLNMAEVGGETSLPTDSTGSRDSQSFFVF